MLLGRAAHDQPPRGVGRGADRLEQLVVEPPVGGATGLLVAGAEGGVARPSAAACGGAPRAARRPRRGSGPRPPAGRPPPRVPRSICCACHIASSSRTCAYNCRNPSPSACPAAAAGAGPCAHRHQFAPARTTRPIPVPGDVRPACPRASPLVVRARAYRRPDPIDGLSALRDRPLSIRCRRGVPVRPPAGLQDAGSGRGHGGKGGAAADPRSAGFLGASRGHPWWRRPGALGGAWRGGRRSRTLRAPVPASRPCAGRPVEGSGDVAAAAPDPALVLGVDADLVRGGEAAATGERAAWLAAHVARPGGEPGSPRVIPPSRDTDPRRRLRRRLLFLAAGLACFVAMGRNLRSSVLYMYYRIAQRLLSTDTIRRHSTMPRFWLDRTASSSRAGRRPSGAPTAPQGAGQGRRLSCVTHRRRLG